MKNTATIKEEASCRLSTITAEIPKTYCERQNELSDKEMQVGPLPTAIRDTNQLKSNIDKTDKSAIKKSYKFESTIECSK